jgi:hypothetical protein
MSRVAVETRKAYVIAIGGKKRRFWTEAAAYYKLAASLLGQKYLGILRAYEADPDDFQGALTAEAEAHAMTVPQVATRGERAAALFCAREWGGEPFDPRKWQAYVRRVAKKMRAMDARRAAAS